jgi:hypothetical protein
MSTPPLLVTAVLLFWGWQTGHLWLGILAGAVLESSRVIRLRWSLTQADFNRLSNVCIVLFLGVGTFLLINEGTVSFDDFFVNAGRRPEAIRQAGRSALVWFQWFPMIFLPLLLAQVFNDPPRMGLSTFSWWLRKQEARQSLATLPRETVDISFSYVALCLLAASATLERTAFFYWVIVALVGWALLTLRSRQRSLVAWLVLFAVIAAAGFGGHHGLISLQRKLESMNVRWFSQWAGSGFNDREARTRIGSIGRLKNSDRIVLRLTTDASSPPELLREMSFNSYRTDGRNWSFWRVDNREFTSVPGEADQSTWQLLPRKASRRTLTVAGYFRGGEGLLPLPSGSSEVANLPFADIATNLYGAAKMKGGPGLAIFEARYDRGVTFDSGWTTNDLRTYEESEPALASVATELQLSTNLPPAEAMRRVQGFFADKFQYASLLTAEHAATRTESALARFLLHTRSGHCEYFATATTLLLRYAGVPTRYAVGYSVQEGKGKKYVVRDRHAHAWTLVWDGQNWVDLDTTPSTWDAAEAAGASWLQPVKDFFSNLWFQFSKFRWSQTEWRKWFMLAPIPLLIVVLVRFFFGKSWKQMRARRREQAHAVARAGADSDFYRIERYFAARGLERGASENWSDWLRRIGKLEMTVASLHRVLVLHQRHRFDPQGLDTADRAVLREEVSRWLEQQSGSQHRGAA